jgi:hypothetical protein
MPLWNVPVRPGHEKGGATVQAIARHRQVDTYGERLVGVRVVNQQHGAAG